MLHTKYKKQFYTLFTILWICFIFSFSLQSGEDSSQLSSGFGAWLIEHVLSIFSLDTMSADQLDMFHFIIRKCAHFTEFFVLGVLMYLSIREWTVVHKVFVSLILCASVAAMDEMIQLFVDGRSGQITDVLLDSCGALVGVMIIRIFLGRMNTRKYIEEK